MESRSDSEKKIEENSAHIAGYAEGDDENFFIKKPVLLSAEDESNSKNLASLGSDIHNLIIDAFGKDYPSKRSFAEINKNFYSLFKNKNTNLADEKKRIIRSDIRKELEPILSAALKNNNVEAFKYFVQHYAEAADEMILKAAFKYFKQDKHQIAETILTILAENKLISAELFSTMIQSKEKSLYAMLFNVVEKAQEESLFRELLTVLFYTNLPEDQKIQIKKVVFMMACKSNCVELVKMLLQIQFHENLFLEREWLHLCRKGYEYAVYNNHSEVMSVFVQDQAFDIIFFKNKNDQFIKTAMSVIEKNCEDRQSYCEGLIELYLEVCIAHRVKSTDDAMPPQYSALVNHILSTLFTKEFLIFSCEYVSQKIMERIVLTRGDQNIADSISRLHHFLQAQYADLYESNEKKFQNLLHHLIDLAREWYNGIGLNNIENGIVHLELAYQDLIPTEQQNLSVTNDQQNLFIWKSYKPWRTKKENKLGDFMESIVKELRAIQDEWKCTARSAIEAEIAYEKAEELKNEKNYKTNIMGR